MSYSYWKLTVSDRYGTNHIVFGAENAMKSVVDDMRKAIVDNKPRFLEAKGHTETPDRAEVILTILTEDVVAMSVVRIT